MRCPNASVDVLLLLAPPWPATTPLMIVTTNATADRRNTLTDMYIATPNTTRMMPTYGAMAVATPMICSAIVTSGCGGRRVGGAAGAASGSDTDLAREVILAQPAIAAVPRVVWTSEKSAASVTSGFSESGTPHSTSPQQLAMSFEKSRGRRGSLNFERSARAFDESAAPKAVSLIYAPPLL